MTLTIAGCLSKGEVRNVTPLAGGSLSPSARTSASFANEAIEVVVIGLDVGSELLRTSASLLSDTERQKADRFVFDRDRRRFTVARARLRRLLAARLGIRPESVDLVYGAHGKPALSSHCGGSDLRFNVSHCDDVAAYAFCNGREIGIDIETVRSLPDAEDVARRFFSRQENEAYLALDPRDRPRGFFNCWTRKEAFVKALGDGLSYPLDSFDVSLAPCEPARILRVKNVHGVKCGWTLHSFGPAAGMVGAVVVQEVNAEASTARIAVRSPWR